MRARLALSSGDAEGAIEALAAPTDAAYPIVAVERHVLRALALRALGDDRAALAELESALSRAEPEAIRRPFLSAGRGVRELLAEHLRRAVSHRWFASELMRRLEVEAARGVRAAPSCSSRCRRARAKCSASCRR